MKVNIELFDCQTINGQAYGMFIENKLLILITENEFKFLNKILLKSRDSKGRFVKR